MTGPGRYRDDEQPDDYGDTPLDRLGFSSGPDPVRRASRGGPRRPRGHRLLVGAGAATALLLVVIAATELVGHQGTPTGTPSSAADPRDLTGSPPATAAAPSVDVPSAAPPVIPPAGPTVTVLPPPSGAQPTSLLPPTPQLPEPSDPSTTSAPTTSESDPSESTGAGGDQGSAGAAPTTATPTSSPPTALPTRAAPPTRSPEPTPGAAAAGSAGAAPSSTVVPIPPSKPPKTGDAGADDGASLPVVHIVRRPDGTSTITVSIGDTTIGPVTVPSDATTRVPNPPVSVAPQHTVPPTSTNPPTSTDAPDTTNPAAQPPDAQTPVPGKAPPDLQTPDIASVSQTPGSDANGTAQGSTGSQQIPQTTVPGKAPVDGQTPETQTPGTQTPRPRTAQTPPSDGQTTGGTGGRGNGSSDDTAGATGTGNGGSLAPDAGAPSTFEVIPSPGNDVQQAPARTRSRTSSGPANTIEPGGPVVGSEAALQPPVIVQTQVNLAESTPDPGATDSRGAAGWFTAFALGALIAAGVIVAGLALRRRGDHGP